MHKSSLLLTFLLGTTSIFAENISDDKYLQIVGDNLEVKDNIINANGDVLLFTPNYFITANKVIYDKNSSKIELFDDVNIVKDKQFTTYSKYAYMNLEKEETKLEPLLLINNETNLWFSSEQSNKKQDAYELKNTTLSSCDCSDPAWKVGFSSGDYNTTKKWVNTYDTTLYINDVPVFYTPYFGFPADKTRRTGLLRPTLGYSSDEGALYAQPIYFAPKANYDMEYIPQVRSNRGHGHAFKYRFKDSIYSRLDFETGVFKEKSEYQELRDLENDKHYGWDLKYKRDKLFTKSENSDGLLIKSLDMNDVDYINTKYNNNTFDETDKFLESQLKYYFSTNRYYGDLDIKLYNDISKDNNDDVMQTLPAVNLHKYSDLLFLNNLSYSLDLKSINKTRKIGIGANITTLEIPITYHRRVFNDYLNISITEQFNFTNFEYTNNQQQFQNGKYGENNHIVSLYTDLLKPYKETLHSIKLDTTLTYGNTYLTRGDIYGVNSTDTDLETFGITKSSKKLSVGLSQTLYGKRDLKEIFKHTLVQPYLYNEQTKTYVKGELENDLTIYHPYGLIANRITYDHEINEFITSATTLELNYNDYFLNAYHKNTKDKDTLKNTETVNYNLGFKFDKYYSTSYKEEYDLSNNISKKKEYIFDIDKKCWGLNFKFVDAIVATSTKVDSTLRQNILYVELNLKQLFKIDQVHKFDVRNQ